MPAPSGDRPRVRCGASREERIIETLLAAIEVAVLAFAGAQAWRILAMPVVRREATEHRKLAKALAGAGIALAASAIALAVAYPLARHLLVAVTLASMLAAWWRARDDYGAGRRWPPGSLGLRASLAAIDDRRYYFDQAARHGPVFKSGQFGRPVACVVGHDRARRILVDSADALAPATLPYNRLLAKGILRYMSGPTHDEEAPVFRLAFANADLVSAEPALRASLRRELDALAAGSASGAGGVYARPAFERWLVGAVSRVFFGLLPDDARVAEIARQFGRMDYLRRADGARRREMVDALDSVVSVIRDAGRERPIAGTSALDVMLASDPGSLDRPARVENFAVIARLVVGDLTGLLDWIFRMLDNEAHWIDAVRARGRSAGAGTRTPPLDPATAIVMETLRLEQSEFLYRRVVKPIDVEGRTIPAGWLLRVCVQEAHRDPAVFPDPDRFDPSRFVDRLWSRREYSPFGGHTHGCMGAHLAHFLGRMFVEELALGYEWTVVRDGPPEHGTRHRDHWRPSATRRVLLRPRRDPILAAIGDVAADAGR